jgi:hypothetical protein
VDVVHQQGHGVDGSYEFDEALDGHGRTVADLAPDTSPGTRRPRMASKENGGQQGTGRSPGWERSSNDSDRQTGEIDANRDTDSPVAASRIRSR